MIWNLESVDGTVILALNVQDGPLSGTLTVNNVAFTVSGGWAAAFSTKDRGASAFYLSGQTPTGPSNYVGAAGNMVGLADWPQSIQIAGGNCSSKDGKVNAFNQTLLPILNTVQSNVQAVYSEIGCKLNIALDAVPPKCMSGTIGGNPMTPAQCAAVCTGGTPPDPLLIHIPPNAGNKPVGVVLLMGAEGPGDFRAPVLAEFHGQILKILYDTTVNGLVLEYANTPGNKHDTQPIVFNGEQRKRPHASIIIRPN